MAVWVVRAGHEGMQERVALENGVAVIEYLELPGLATLTRDELVSEYRSVLPGVSEGTVRNDTGQIWNFVHGIQPDDLIILPLKASPGHVAIGLVTGPYEYRTDLGPDIRHTRPVRWLQRDVPRESFRDDLIASFNRPMTVIPVRRDEAHVRVEAVLDGGIDPGPSASEPGPKGTTAAHPRLMDMLRATFQSWRELSGNRFVFKLHAWRAEHLRRLLSDPDAVNLDAFNREVWLRQSRVVVRGRAIPSSKFDAMVWSADEVAELNRALDGGQLEYHGNSVWGAGAHIYGAMLKASSDEKEATIRKALHILVDRALQPLQKAAQIMDLPGFGPNIATGLVMIFHPDEFALYNVPSKGAMSQLGFEAGSLAAFEESARRLKEELGAENFLELDSFLEQIHTGKVKFPDGAPDVSVWTFQANPRYYNLAEALKAISVGDEGEWFVSRYGSEMKPGDTILLWQGGEQAGIYAIGEITSELFNRPRGDWHPHEDEPANTETAVRFRYSAILKQPVLKEALQGDPVLRELQILRAPQGTNFRVTKEQWYSLQPLIHDSIGIDPRPSLSGLASRLFVTPSWLQEIHELLAARRQVIFYGPPGTGKTYIARELARWIASDAGRVRVVQFHPSYSYEDFVEGYRPGSNGSGFTLVKGPLMELANEAREHPDETHVLLIDEINRGNIAKVFGEMYFLLEYRSEEMRLLYSRDPFALPENLWIIGTMNTADRSIALLDAALRRRFFFIPFFPHDEPIKDVLRNWLTSNKPGLEWVADVVDRANQEIGDRNSGIGPSYFMRKELDGAWIGRIWKYSVMPYLEEQFFGDEQRLKDFELGAIQTRALSNGAPSSGQVEEIIDGNEPG